VAKNTQLPDYIRATQRADIIQKINKSLQKVNVKNHITSCSATDYTAHAEAKK